MFILSYIVNFNIYYLLFQFFNKIVFLKTNIIIKIVITSAKGIVSQTPVIPINLGRININGTIAKILLILK